MNKKPRAKTKTDLTFEEVEDRKPKRLHTMEDVLKHIINHRLVYEVGEDDTCKTITRNDGKLEIDVDSREYYDWDRARLKSAAGVLQALIEGKTVVRSGEPHGSKYHLEFTIKAFENGFAIDMKAYHYYVKL